MTKHRIALVCKGTTKAGLLTYPIAAAYLKLLLEKDAELCPEITVSILNFSGNSTPDSILTELIAFKPTIVGFSVYGWNYRALLTVASKYKELSPDCVIIMGGPHVSDRAKTIFQEGKAIDVVVNGEGEATFHELVRTIVRTGDFRSASATAGISCRSAKGVVTNSGRPPIARLDEIPSPLLNEATPLFTAGGAPIFDVAIIETSRGCPFACSFCNWTSGLGGRVRHFSLDRLKAEIEYVASKRIDGLVLTDANFGMYECDVAFAEALAAVKRRTGYPTSLETSWTKIKSPTFVEVTRILKSCGLTSSIGFALQTFNPLASQLCGRGDIKLGPCVESIRELQQRGFSCHGELIWGLPGETPSSFVEGFDRFCGIVGRVAAYPLILLPNTRFYREKSQHGIVTLKGERDDFDHFVSHASISAAENAEMQRFIFWSRLLIENGLFLRMILVLGIVTEIRPSEVIKRVDRWLEHQTDPFARHLHSLAASYITTSAGTSADRALTYVYHNFATYTKMMTAFAEETLLPACDAERRPYLREVLRFALLTRPRFMAEADMESTTVNGRPYYKLSDVSFDYDFRNLPEPVALWAECWRRIERKPQRYNLWFPAGFEHHFENHEKVVEFEGQLELISCPIEPPLEATPVAMV